MITTAPAPAGAARAALTPLGAIAGTGFHVPAIRYTNADVERRMDTSDQWIVERTGIRERRLAAPDEATASLAVAAGRAALADAGVDAGDLDLIVVATCTPDQPVPATAAFVADALGARCGAMDLQAACSGFVYGLVTTAALVQAAGYRRVLLIGAETLSRITDFGDRSTGMLFGDGAGAVVLVAAEAAGPNGAAGQTAAPGLIAWDLGCDGSAAGILEVPAGGSRQPASAATVRANLHVLRMEGRDVYKRAVRAVVDSVAATLAVAGVTAADVDLFVPHQANVRIVDAVLARTGIAAERTIINIDRYGNTSAASIPIALAEARTAGRLHDGDLVLLSGFGAGLTWATALLRWGRPAA